jgi:hypothetical protein
MQRVVGSLPCGDTSIALSCLGDLGVIAVQTLWIFAHLVDVSFVDSALLGCCARSSRGSRRS